MIGLGALPVAPIAPPTTIPCYCWSSPGFKEAHAAAYAAVQKDVCKHDSACMQQDSIKNLINYRALERGAALCKEEFDPCCRPSGGLESCPGGRRSSSKLPQILALIGVGAVAWWMIRNRRR